MQRLGKNVGKYLGDTLDVQQTLRDIEAAAQQHGWKSETFFESKEKNLKLFALARPALRPPASDPSTINHQLSTPRIYISAGIHGDEPAGPLAALK